MNLIYKASTISKMEAEQGKNFFEIFSNLTKGVPQIHDLYFLFKAGGGSDEQFDELFAKGMEEIIIVIIKGIGDSGFLGEMNIDEKAIREEMRKAKEEAIALQNSGETAKA